MDPLVINVLLPLASVASIICGVYLLCTPKRVSDLPPECDEGLPLRGRWLRFADGAMLIVLGVFALYMRGWILSLNLW